jgi:hypothetical protein
VNNFSFSPVLIIVIHKGNQGFKVACCLRSMLMIFNAYVNMQ